MRPIDLFVFDIAGTTVKDDGLVIAAFRNAAATADLHPAESWLKPRMGLNKIAVFEEMLRDQGRDTGEAMALAHRFDDEIAEWIAHHGVTLLNGAAEAVERLRREDIRIGFSTGFSRTTGELVVQGAGLEADVIVGSDEVAQGRPAPDLIQEAMRRTGVADASRVGVAGDTPSDLQAGSNAGCAFVIGVGHGTHALEELASQPHTHLLADLSTLASTIGLDA